MPVAQIKLWNLAKWLCVVLCILALLYAIVTSPSANNYYNYTPAPDPNYIPLYISAFFALAATTC